MFAKITFNSNDGTKLVGIIQTPKIETNKCVILCHGFKTDKDEYGIYIKLSDELVKNDYAVFRFDFRAHGESTGIDYEMTIEKEIEDLDSAVNFIISKGYSEVNLLGGSFGGGIVTLYSERNEDKLKRLILWYPLLDYQAALISRGSFRQENYEKALKNGYVKITSKTTAKTFRLSKEVFEQGLRLKPFVKLSNLKLPILFIHGTNDESISYELSIKYSELCQNSEIQVIDGASHGFHDSDKDLKLAIDATINFINNKRKQIIVTDVKE